MKLFTKYVLFLLAFIIVAQANIAPLKSSYDLRSSEYGVRYYDPRTSVWQSPDPILDQYMSGKTNKGVFNPSNLQLYTYTKNNPVNYFDPDGKKWIGKAYNLIGKIPGVKKHVYKPLNKLGNRVNNFFRQGYNKAENFFKGTSQNTGTVWDSIKATQPSMQGTIIPKSFELTTKGGKFWVHPNATKHMAEFLKGTATRSSTPLNNQAFLKSFHAAVEGATTKGYQYNKMIQVGRWQLMFAKKAGDKLPVIKHALYK